MFDNYTLNLEEEVICDHLVTTETKKVWCVLLDLFDQLDRICKKHNIKYFAGGGTLLGAVRHKGFIPWDDDMDFSMLTEDYLKFCEVAKDELEEPYFFQHYKSEDGVYWPDLVLIRRSDTTGCTQRGLDGYIPPANMGIFIDIFPLTNVPSNRVAYEMHTAALKLYRKAIRGRENYLHAQYKGTLSRKLYFSSSYITWKFVSLFSKDYVGMCDKFIKVLTNVKDSGYVGIKSYITHNKKYEWPSHCYDEVIYMPFENRTIPCPKGYDEVLRHQYGDYMKFVKGDALHTMVVANTDVPYKELIPKITGVKPDV